MKKKSVVLIFCLLFAMSVMALCSCEQPSQEYSVTFKFDNEVVYKQTFTSLTDTITAPAVPAKKGYIGAWENYELALKDITVNAVYTAKQYAVTLDYNGGASANMPNTLSVTYGKAVGDLPVVTKQYYQFDGWYLDGNVKVTAQTIWSLDADATLYAKFTQPSSTLLDVQGAAIVGKQITMTVAKDCQSVDLSSIVIVSDDSEWMLYRDTTMPPFPATVLMPVSDKVAVLQNGYNTFYIVLNNSVDDKYTLTICRPYDVEINYIAETADGEIVYTEQVEAGREYALTYVPDYRGYVFNGWMDGDAMPISSITPFEDVDVCADLTPNDYKCILDVNGGDELPVSQITVTFGEYFQLPVPSKDGFDFLGWYVGDEQITDDEGSSIFLWDYDEDITMVAQWEEIDDHTIVFYSTQGASLQVITQKAIDNFQANHPEWKIKHVVPSNSYNELSQQILAELQSGKQPDLAYCYGHNVAQYMSYGKLVNWSQYISANDMADFVPSFMDECSAVNLGDYDLYGYNSTDLLMMPFVKSCDVMFYNIDALTQCGLTVPTSWDDLWLQCGELKAMFRNCTPLSVDSEANWFISTCYQNSWGYTSINSEQRFIFNGTQQQDWLNRLSDYYNRGLFTTMGLSHNYSSALLNQGVDGGAIFAIGSSAGASHYAIGNVNIGVAPIPGVSSVLQGPSLCMFANDYFANDSERKQMTYEFAKALWNAEFLAEFCQSSGYAPSRQSVYDVPSFAEFIQENSLIAEAYRVVMRYADRMFVSPAFVGSDTAREQVGLAFVDVMQNNVSAEQALQTAYDNCLASPPKRNKNDVM